MLGSYVFGFRAGEVVTGNVISSFNNPIVVTFSYDNSLLGNLDESSLKLYRNPQDGSGWLELSNGSLDTANNIVTGETTAFSKFAVFGSETAVEPEPEPSPAPSGGGGGGGGGGGAAPYIPLQLAAPAAVSCTADFNGDVKVNSVDFSILLFYWKTSLPFANSKVDINKDGKADSVDFSILLFQWGSSCGIVSINFADNPYLALDERAWYNNKKIV